MDVNQIVKEAVQSSCSHSREVLVLAWWRREQPLGGNIYCQMSNITKVIECYVRRRGNIGEANLRHCGKVRASHVAGSACLLGFPRRLLYSSSKNLPMEDGDKATLVSVSKPPGKRVQREKGNH